MSNIDQRLGTRHGRLAYSPASPVMTKVAAMPSVARVAYIPLKAFAVNVIAIYSRARRKRHKPDSITTLDPRVERLYSLDELTELRRKMLRYARSFAPGDERNHHRQIA